MKNIFILFLLNSVFTYAQNTKKNIKIEYINMSSVSFTKNTESYYSKDSIRNMNGGGLDINTIHGIKFFGYVAISAGVSLDLNINKTFISTPVIFDLRVFSSKKSGNKLFAYLQTGQNIKWSGSFNGKGTSSKLGVGAIFYNNEAVSYYFDIFKKSKQIVLEKNKEKGNYNISGFGISLGATF